MATLTVGLAGAFDIGTLKLTNPSLGPAVLVTPDRVVFDYGGGDQNEFRGVGLAYTAGVGFTGGTITGLHTVRSFGASVEVTGASVPAVALQTLIGAANEPAALDLFFGGNDVFNGGAFTDKVRMGAGDDLLRGEGGDDTLDGGAGVDTLILGGARADYLITHNLTANTYIVKDLRAQAPDGTDTVLNVELVRFSDHTGQFMSTVASTLLDVFGRVLRVDPRFGPYLPTYTAMVSAAEGGALTVDQAVKQIIQLADSTTSVASLSYQFFLGHSPTAAGLDYLVSPTGPNANNLLSPYYQGFNLENRYINFAVNLGKLGEGATAFSAKYGSLSLLDATKTAYKAIFGVTATDAKAHDIIDSRADYFASYGGDGTEGLGTKAAMVGWLLGEAAKADTGVLQLSNLYYLTDLASGGSTGAVNIVGAYGGYVNGTFGAFG